MDDILEDDLNVMAMRDDAMIEVHWIIPEGCNEDVTLSMKANEYESPEENAFHFPAKGTPLQTYSFQNNGSLTVDGVAH